MSPLETAYFKTVRTTAKGRWFGKTLKQIAHELGPGAVVTGPPDHVLKDHDLVEYKVHVHEPSIPAFTPSIIFEDRDFLVINKPSGIPVHPTVNYFYNTVTELLREKYGVLRPCYRLDRLTSGVLVFATSSDAASLFKKHESSACKVYYAQVCGRVREPMMVDTPIATFNAKRGYSAFQETLHKAKHARTLIEPVLALHDGCTIVRCIPYTGRTHQIRKHLAIAGHPIADDQIYNTGAFAALMEDPSQGNFEILYTEYTRRAQKKQTGISCPECDTQICDNGLEELRLHCSSYKIMDMGFTAPNPAWLPAAATTEPAQSSLLGEVTPTPSSQNGLRAHNARC